jgi:hypothetical protein
MDTPFDSWSTQTLIAGLSIDGMIAPWVICYLGARPGPMMFSSHTSATSGYIRLHR